MVQLLKKAYFLLTRVNISQSQLNHLISRDITITLCDVDKIDCEKTWVQFAPLRCRKASHEDFIYDDPKPKSLRKDDMVNHEAECRGYFLR